MADKPKDTSTEKRGTMSNVIGPGLIPDREDFDEVDLIDSSLPPAARYRHAQNLKFHRLAEATRFGDVPGETGKPTRNHPEPSSGENAHDPVIGRGHVLARSTIIIAQR
jgi:hypothetical protein